ncbi:MAG: aminopeptidase P family protein [Eubacteriales bacterium]|nr:aminopeptidase P family protein [Eubacteriales bacterium]
MARERLERLRERMRDAGIGVYVIPSTDCHESEYVCPHYRAREYLTGFTGSAGTAVVTPEEAGLWTDGRYFLQAERQLQGSGVRLFRMGEPDTPDVETYVESRLAGTGALGFDGRTMGEARAGRLRAAAARAGATVRTDRDLVGEIWTGRPDIPDGRSWVLEERWSGESAESKLARLREQMERAGADVHVLASLCDIAWLLNVRGSDIPCVPVTLSFLTVTRERCVWYARPSAADGVRAYLESLGVDVRDYEEIYGDLKKLPAESRVLLDRRNVNSLLVTSLPAGAQVIDRPNPTELMKAVKNETELENLREAHRKESVAFTRFMYWLKTTDEEITELSAAAYLEARRREQEHYLEQSFAPICAYGEHGAVVHYSATEESSVPVERKGFLLVDAGGHYLEGTTDTTRTFAMGPLTDEERRMYTAVCRGNLRLAHARFLRGCTGLTLDVLCREPLWELGMDYRHGTGHGVGYLLNVHEGPNAFRWRNPAGETPAPLEPGMVTTDEPGVYPEGRFGVRLENELVCRELEENEYGRFLQFEILTKIPFDLDAIDAGQLTEQEKTWLNDYHRSVYETVSPFLPEEERIWLQQFSQPGAAGQNRARTNFDLLLSAEGAPDHEQR